MLRYILLILAVLSLTGCTSSRGASDNYMNNCVKGVSSFFSKWGVNRKKNQHVNYYVETEETTRDILVYSEKLKYEKQLQLEDAKICDNQGLITRITLNFYSMANVDICEARMLLVDVVEGLLDKLNQDPNVTPYVLGGVFTANNLEVYIRFDSFNTTVLDLQKVGLITLRNGIAHFISSDAFYCEGECWHRRYEPYYQSKEFVTFQREGEKLHKPGKEKPQSAFLKEERYIPTDFGSPGR